MPDRKKVAVHVLGCKVNQSEAENITRMFQNAGCEIVDFTETADIYIIHTCTVTGESDKKSRQSVRRAVRKNPKAVIAVTGCYAQTSSSELSNIEGVDLIVGVNELHTLVDLVEKYYRIKQQIVNVRNRKDLTTFQDLNLMHPGRVRAFLKLQEGCEQFCTYCIVPYARGPARSRGLDETIKNIKELISQGYKEIVLTGIRLGVYGCDLNPRTSLAALLKEACSLKGLGRLRVSSVDPNDFDSELINVITGEEKICPHYHIPLQSGDDFILKRMNRHYNTSEFTALVEKLQKKRPGASITTDVIVGFPGEKEEHFRNTKIFLKRTGFMDAHIFKYSPREGTPAASFSDQIAKNIKSERSRELYNVTEELFEDYAYHYIGKKLNVLVEQRNREGECIGHTSNYLTVKFKSEAELRGNLVAARLKKIITKEKSIIGEGLSGNTVENY